jgi:hypothetical protein
MVILNIKIFFYLRCFFRRFSHLSGATWRVLLEHQQDQRRGEMPGAR